MKPFEADRWRQGFWLDMSVAAAYTAIAIIEITTSPRFEDFLDPPLVLFVLLQTGFLGLRRRFPLAVHAVGALGLAIQAASYPIGLTTTATLVTLYSAAAYCRPRGVVAALTITIADVAWVITRNPAWDIWDMVDTYILWIGVGGLGVFFRLQQANSERQTRRYTQLEHEHGMARQAAVVEERARMARELHDSVGHAVTGIVLLAGAVRKVDDDPKVVRDAIGAIERSGLEAMTELDAVVGLLRDGDEPDSVATRPGLAYIDRLIAKAESVGLEVQASIEEHQPLPTATDRAAFRIVQESLTNATRYANPRRASVRVQSSEDVVQIEIENPVASPIRASSLSSGRGLIGMDERVAILGGTFSAGATGKGSFLVSATLPIRNGSIDGQPP